MAVRRGAQCGKQDRHDAKNEQFKKQQNQHTFRGEDGSGHLGAGGTEGQAIGQPLSWVWGQSREVVAKSLAQGHWGMGAAQEDVGAGAGLSLPCQPAPGLKA